MRKKYTQEYLNSLIGQKFNKLTICSIYKEKQTMCFCKCDCGKTISTRLSRVVNGETISCRCVRKKYKDRHKADLIYLVWFCMINRCYKPTDKRYCYYGQRGITVCDEWKNSFDKFYNWSIKNGYNNGLSLDRINNDGNYEPSNCRWATKTQQARNKRNNKLITYKNETHCVAEWCELLGLNYNLVRGRLAEGWSIERAFETSIKKKKI